MPRITIPVVVKDPEVTEYKEIDPVENVVVVEDVFLDGPVSPRVAILDFDETDGRLHAGTPFVSPQGQAPGRYALDNGPALRDRAFVRVSAFGTVYKVLRMWEEPDALGRQVQWAFVGPQLLVVPQAGEWRNAFYQRESRSLQFFFFKSDPGPRIYTALSQDIVAHETAHAVLDGIAPDLYDALLPESLAIHEAVADLTAVLAAFRSRDLARRVLQQNGGTIRRSSAFNGLAEQFGHALGGGRLFLRDLLNDKRLADVDASEPHALSEVLSGALYKSVVELQQSLRKEFTAKAEADPELAESDEQQQAQNSYRRYEAAQKSISPADVPEAGAERADEKALWVAGARLKRTLYRGLDYLPPGEVGFADFARALLAADAASHPDSDKQRQWIREEFVKRGIVAKPSELEVPTNFEDSAVSALDLEALVESDWLAYDFANQHRALLGIPPDLPFRVSPRLVVSKRYYHRGGAKVPLREVLFKVGWTELEANDVGEGLPRSRRYNVGTTLAVDWDSRRVRAKLTSRSASPERSAARSAFLTRLLAEDLLRVGDAGMGVDAQPVALAPRAEVTGDVLRVRATACLLHLVEERPNA